MSRSRNSLQMGTRGEKGLGAFGLSGKKRGHACWAGWCGSLPKARSVPPFFLALGNRNFRMKHQAAVAMTFRIRGNTTVKGVSFSLND
jgi:hypothetical protein